MSDTLGGRDGSGGKTEYVTTYRPSLLDALPRNMHRTSLGIGEDSLPFKGMDVWNAFEFSWLNPRGKPQVAIARFEIPAKSPGLIESKSLKLYLGSFSQTKFGHRAEVISTLESDLTVAARAPISVGLLNPELVAQNGISRLDGTSLDTLEIDINKYDLDPGFLGTESGVTTVRESLFTHLFRSVCPMTGQPDVATVHIQYSGRQINHEGLLRYLVSYRSHGEFAEHIVERIFMDITNQCSPDRLTVHAYFTRRGGIDINPFRSRDDLPANDLRLWRQ